MYFSDRFIVACKYFTTEPSATVNINLPPQFKHLPASGGLLYFSLHFTHLNSCVENFLRFPFVSFSKCFSITNAATSLLLTDLNFSAISIWPVSFSSIDGSVLYALQFTVLFRFVVSCVNFIPSYCPGLCSSSLTCFIFISQGFLYSCAA